MHYSLLACAFLGMGQAKALEPGDHLRTITVDEKKRIHWIHVPAKYDPLKATAVVLVLHGAMMDGKVMEGFCGLNKTADKHNFIVVYPNGTGPSGFFQTWNAGVFPGELNKQLANDVKYLRQVLDDVDQVINTDKKRIYAAGLSNGGMMVYRLASELSDRIAAIASVAGVIVLEKYQPPRPVPVIHFHGTKDTLVPFDGPPKKKDTPRFMRFRSVDETIQMCVKVNGCNDKATVTELDTKDDQVKIIRKEYGQCQKEADVVLYVIENGGHTWPGMWAPPFLGITTRNFSANEVMWKFFVQHPLK